ncbi:MAG: FG-GAP repeat protein [Planctomycetes bacterium]|nr:FG-GAP repeat protein [Planctomycetota bacterium]
MGRDRSRLVSLSIVAFLCLLPVLSLAGDPLSIVYDLSGADCVVSADRPLQGLGFEVFGLGDVNGDGFDDLSFFGGQEPTFHAYLLYGRATLPTEIDVAHIEEYATRLESESDEIWPVPSPVGDVNGDGFDDVAFRHCTGHLTPVEVGLSIEKPTAITVMYGSSQTPSSINVDEIVSSQRGFLILPVDDEDSNRFAKQPVLGADINGDGFSDIVVATPEAIVADIAEAGLVYLIFGGSGLPGRISLSELGSEVPGSTLSFSSPVDLPETIPLWFGKSTASAGDIDGDGFGEILIAAPGWEMDEAMNHWDGGAVVLLYGTSALPPFMDVAGESTDRTIFYSTIGGSPSYNVLGSRYVDFARDFNLDGRPDFLLSTNASMQYAPYAVAYRGFVVASPLSERPLRVEVNRDVGIAAVSPAAPGASSGIERALAVSDFNGDGFGDVLASVPSHRSMRPDLGGEGAAFLILGRQGPPRELVLANSPDDTIQFLSGVSYSFLGKAIASCDLNGDGFSDVIVGAPGRTYALLDPDGIGRVYVVLGAPDSRQPLAPSHFVPPSSPVTGGAMIRLYGQGFTSEARVFFGTTEATEYERVDSGLIKVKTPPASAEGDVQVRIVSDSQEVWYGHPFTYRNQPFPPLTYISELDEHLISIPRATSGLPTRFSPSLSRAGDVTGDGIDDLVFCTNGSTNRDVLERVYVLRGGPGLPAKISQDSLTRYGSSFFLPDTEMGLGFAQGIGDFNGDGIRDIGAASLGRSEAYVVLGGAFADGEFNIYQLIDGDAGHMIMDVASPEIVPVGDVNADGFADFAIRDWNGSSSGGSIGTVSLVLGGAHLPRSIRFSDLPMIEGRVAPGGYYSHLQGPWGIGDVDGDGFDDIGMISMLELDDTESEGDQRFHDVYVVFGRASFPRRSKIEEEVEAGTAIRLALCDEPYQNTLAWFVPSMCTGGDIDRDGILDMLVYVAHAWEPAFGEGVYIERGAPRSSFPHDLRLGHPEDFSGAVLWDLNYNNDRVRTYGMDGGQDFNSDGRPDLLVMESKYVNRNPGRLFVIFDPKIEAGETHPLSDVPRGDLPGVVLEDDVGLSTAWPKVTVFAGDLNDDGIEDIATSVLEWIHIWLSPVGIGVSHDTDFLRGDANQDGGRDIGDAIFVLNYLFVPDEPTPPCADAADVNDDGSLDLGDPVYHLNWIFADGPAPAAPSGACGPDPTEDALNCLESVCQ